MPRGVLARLEALLELGVGHRAGVGRLRLHREAALREARERADEVGGEAADDAGAHQDRLDVPVGVVVGEDRAVEVLVGPGGAQVARGREDRVDRVERVLLAVAVGVDAVHVPRRGHELHPAQRAGGGDVQVAAVVGLDLVDRGQDLPADAVLDAGRLVDREQEGRDAELLDEEVRDADRSGARGRERVARVRRWSASRRGCRPGRGCRRRGGSLPSDPSASSDSSSSSTSTQSRPEVEVETLPVTTEPTSSPFLQASSRPATPWVRLGDFLPRRFSVLAPGVAVGDGVGARRGGRVRRLLRLLGLLGRLRRLRGARGRGRRVLRGLGRRGDDRLHRRGEGRGLRVDRRLRRGRGRGGSRLRGRGRGIRGHGLVLRERARAQRGGVQAGTHQADGGESRDHERLRGRTEVSGRPGNGRESRHTLDVGTVQSRLEPRNRGQEPIRGRFHDPNPQVESG